MFHSPDSPFRSEQMNFMGFRMTKTEIQCIEDLSVNEVFIEREER